jgi:rhamnosyltransferase
VSLPPPAPWQLASDAAKASRFTETIELRVISIVIPVKNGGSSLRRCLEAIRDQRVDDEIEIVVVDSGSRDGSQALARSFGAVVHEIEPSEFNHGETRNLGARLSSGETVVFTVDDALPLNDRWLAELTAPLHVSREIAGTYGRHLPYPEAPPHQAYYIDYRFGPRPRVQRAIEASDLRLADILFSNVSSAIRREVLEQFPFASDIVIAEDSEWCSRVLVAGWTIAYVPEAIVRHSHVYSLSDTVKRYFDQGAATERTFPDLESSPAAGIRGDGLRYVLRELGWMWRSGHRSQIPAAVAHEAARFVGFQLGVHNRRVPKPIRARVSRTPVYWTNDSS